jgi:hypothetical protein
VGEYVEISPSFIPRLGFAPETNFKGFAGSLELTRQFSKGALMDYNIGISGHVYDNYRGGGKYRRQIELEQDFGLRNNLGFGFSLFYREFRDFRDKLFSGYIVNPRNDPYRTWSLEYQHGDIAGKQYTSIEPAFRYRPYRNLQLAASYQTVRHFENESQLIMSGSYDINAFDSVSGRLIQRGKDVNAYMPTASG